MTFRSVPSSEDTERDVGITRAGPGFDCGIVQLSTIMVGRYGERYVE